MSTTNTNTHASVPPVNTGLQSVYTIIKTIGKMTNVKAQRHAVSGLLNLVGRSGKKFNSYNKKRR